LQIIADPGAKPARASCGLVGPIRKPRIIGRVGGIDPGGPR